MARDVALTQDHIARPSPALAVVEAEAAAAARLADSLPTEPEAVVARVLLMPTRMSDGRAMALLRRLSPGDLGLKFHEMSFAVSDEQSGAAMKIASTR